MRVNTCYDPLERSQGRHFLRRPRFHLMTIGLNPTTQPNSESMLPNFLKIQSIVTSKIIYISITITLLLVFLSGTAILMGNNVYYCKIRFPTSLSEKKLC